jgi:hypothetical protein
MVGLEAACDRPIESRHCGGKCAVCRLAGSHLRKDFASACFEIKGAVPST